MSYSTKPMPQDSPIDFVERLRRRGVEIDHRTAPIPGEIADVIAVELREAALTILGYRDREKASASLAVVDQVASERQRQIAVEGWSPAHDDTHDKGELAMAAAAYIIEGTPNFPPMYLWPWYSDYWKPKDKRRNLIRAAALLVAEIERLDRLQLAEPRGEETQW